MGRDGNGNGVKGIPPSNHKNSNSAFMNVDISSISRCLCRASPKKPPHLPPVTNSSSTDHPPQTSTSNTHGIPTHVHPRHHQESNTYKATPRKAHAPWPNAKQTAHPKTPSARCSEEGLGFSQARKGNDKKNKRQGSQPTTPFCVSPASREEGGGKECKI